MEETSKSNHVTILCLFSIDLSRSVYVGPSNLFVIYVLLDSDNFERQRFISIYLYFHTTF